MTYILPKKCIWKISSLSRRRHFILSLQGYTVTEYLFPILFANSEYEQKRFITVKIN